MDQHDESSLQYPSDLVTPEELLDHDDYNNYRSIRAITVIYVALSGLMAFSGAAFLIFGLLGGFLDGLGFVIAMISLSVGVCGVVGGRSVLRGDKQRADLLYLPAILFLFGFPIGTILGYVVIKGLPKYLQTMEMLAQRRNAQSQPEKSDQLDQ